VRPAVTRASATDLMHGVLLLPEVADLMGCVIFLIGALRLLQGC